jgi:Domain of unknown function (DUF4365)
VIADLSYHHLASRVVGCGFAIEGVAKDYGYDCVITTVDEHGFIENAYILVQLKATDNVKVSRNRKSVLVRVSSDDVHLWEGEFVPVYLVLFDAKRRIAYWVYFQRYLQKRGIIAGELERSSLLVKIRTSNNINKRSIRRWREDKRRFLAAVGKVRHA